MNFILASGSSSRAQILRDAGVSFTVHSAQIDEDAIKNEMRDANGRSIVETLADRKALHISTQHPQDLVLGADQVLLMGEELFSKAPTRDAAETQLRQLRGKSHQLIGTLTLARGGKPLWRHTDTASLWMRDFSDDFLRAYLAAEGDAVLHSVGCYRLEGPGIQLFEKVEGDYFSILGLPLLPLLAALRDHGVLER